MPLKEPEAHSWRKAVRFVDLGVMSSATVARSSSSEWAL
jgi:hypothetical protein